MFSLKIEDVDQVFVDSLISEQVSSVDISVSIKALKQLDQLLKDPSKNALLNGRVRQLLSSIICQFHIVRDLQMSDREIDSENLFKNLCITLTSLLDCDSLSKEFAEASSGLFIEFIVMVPRDKIDLVESIMLKMVDRSEHTTCVVDLVLILHIYCPISSPLAIKHFQLVLKCLRKFNQQFPSVIDQVNLSQMFRKIHNFFILYPMRYWKNQPDDTPMRILKSIMLTAVKRFGNEVLNHLTMIFQPQTSEVFWYLKNAITRPTG